MKILFVLTPAFNPNDGGVQRTTFKLGKCFTENGLQVSYISLAHEGHVDAEFGDLYHSKLDGGCNNSKNIQYMDEVLGTVQPDIVINQMPYEVALRNGLADAKKKHGFTLLGCLRNSLFAFKSNAKEIAQRTFPKWSHPFIDNPLGIGVLQAYHKSKHSSELKTILDVHDKYILLAPPNRDELEYFVGKYQSDKVLSIPNSIPEVFDSEVKKEKIILHVGRLNIAQKRSDLLAPFWKGIQDQLPDWKFVIVGDGPYRKTLEQEIRDFKLERIELVGYQKPEEFYKRASIFMMPSAFEGFPNTILEAQSYGCVSFVFNSYAALDWIVNDGDDSFLSPPFQTNVMVDQMVKLAKSDERLAEMRGKSFANAKRFTIDQVGKIWLKFFKELEVVES